VYTPAYLDGHVIFRLRESSLYIWQRHRSRHEFSRRTR